MRKCFGVVLISFILVAFLFTACGKKTVPETTESPAYTKHGSSDYLNNIESPETVDESVLERVTGFAEGETGIAEESDIEPEYGNPQGDAEYEPSDSDAIIITARNLLECLNIVEILNGCCLDSDPSKTVTRGSYTYEYVTDSSFQSIKEIKSFLYTYFTPDYIRTQCYYILGLGNKPYYIEIEENDDGITEGLYQMVNNNGYYQYNPEQAIVVSHSDNPKFSATTSFYNDGNKYKLLYKVLWDDGWKIDKTFISESKLQ